MSKLEELYYGNIAPWERTIGKDSESYKLSRQIIELEGELFDGLSDDRKELYDKIAEQRNRRQAIEDKETFIDGFRLGAQLMLDILHGA